MASALVLPRAVLFDTFASARLHTLDYFFPNFAGSTYWNTNAGRFSFLGERFRILRKKNLPFRLLRIALIYMYYGVVK
jgi:hypothetical protein